MTKQDYKIGDLITHVFGQEMVVLAVRKPVNDEIQYDVRTSSLVFMSINRSEIKRD